ncbi:hypothetical protein CBR_g4050 [Chara braunii]|uniref:Integrase catalytic domain-containing protein n=1 Tax=Chara braunii TaxID=69332 RepID=A0A388KH53_CHABU|nr:hypothetical protein CBR_g4050 [Chara braunii]|eukprot:GBG69356.1 hypothetical protein CBR_g4050 [Chara braunii]
MTTMHTPRGLIHMNVAPQGWTSAVAMVQRYMVRAMQPISPHITQPYIDDLVVKGPKEKDEQEVMSGIRRFVWDHVQDLCKVLDLLREHNLTASGPKSRHCMSGTTILGFVCDERGRRPDTKKTNKILEWPTPFETITEVRSFVGTCRFWRIFTKGFAAKTRQLRKLVRQGQDWEWGDKQESVIKGLKKFEEGDLVLGVPDHASVMTRPFIVETDAGPTALGGVLIQRDPNGEERPLRFESRTLNTTERNNSQFKRETLTVLHCLRIFRNYLFGSRFVLRVNPTALAGSLKNFALSDPTITRWLTYIWMFDFELERIPGNKNRPDGLSRVDLDKNSQGVVEDAPPVDRFLDSEEDVRLHINSWSLAVGKYQLQEDLLTTEDAALQVGKHEKVIGGVYLLANALLQEEVVRNTVLDQEEGDNVVHEREDDDFEEGEIKEAFRAEEYEGVYLELGMLFSCEMRERDACARVLKMRPSFLVRDGHLFMRSKGKAPRRVVCGVVHQIDVMAALHDGTAGGHRSTKTTYLKIHELYYWDGMGNMIDDYCKSCVPCQERSSLRPRELLHPRYVCEVGAVVHLDLLAMPLGIGSYNFIVDARDNLSGFVDGRAIRTKTGETLARCIEEYYLHYPFVSRFVMDRGSEFTCAEVKTLLKRYGVIAEYTTAAHPQANAPVERGHSTITNLIAKWTDGRPNQWPNFLRVAFFVDNITVRRSIGYAPATLWYGRHATFPIESFLKTWRRQDLETYLTFEELLDLRARQIGAIKDKIEGATSRVADSRTKDKFRWDKMARVRKEPLKLGDIVLLYDSSLEKQWSQKLDKRWLGPYRVTRCGEHGAYQIEELNGTTWKDWVLGSRLKKFVARDEQGKEPQEVDDKSGKGTCTQEEDLPLFSEVWVRFDKLMDVVGRSGGHHQEMGIKLVSTDLLNLRGVMKEGFAAARASDQKVGERLTKVAQKAYGQRVEWEREIEDLKKELGTESKEVEAVRADMEKIWAENEVVRQVNQTLNKVNDVLRTYLQAQQVSFQAKEVEWEKRIQDLEAKYTRQAPTAVVDWTEVGGFEWRMPAGLTQGRESAMPEERPPAKAMGAEVVSPTTQGEAVRPQEGQESVGQTMAEAESRRDLKGCQESAIPQDMPLVAGLRDALGTWATGSGPEGRVGEQVIPTDERAACPTSPEVPQQEVTSKISTIPSSVPSQEGDKMSQKKVGKCFYCKKGKHRSDDCPKSLKDEANGLVIRESSGVWRDRNGVLVPKTRDGVRAQLYRQLQEVMSGQE